MIYYEEPSATIYQGHALDVLKEMAPESVDCVTTSPPYWGLRTYKTEPQIWGEDHCEHEFIQYDRPNGGGHPSKSARVGAAKVDAQRIYDYKAAFCLKCNAWCGELGLEPTIELYISHLLQIFDEVKRVLKKTGTCWVNIGDSYAGSPPGNKPSWSTSGLHGAATSVRYQETLDQSIQMTKSKLCFDVPAKSLCLIPERFALGMVERGWILRNNIIWYKSNPMPESVKDRFTGTYEYLYFFAKNKRYWFEQQFEPAVYGEFTGFRDHQYENNNAKYGIEVSAGSRRPTGINVGRNKRDVWEINTEPYPEAHFATFPEKLVETPILAGCPSAICKKCGKAREKIYKAEGGSIGQSWSDHAEDLYRGNRACNEAKGGNGYKRTESGYTNCGCNAGFEAGVVLDPFAGSGATGAVAKRFARKYIGIELSERYCKLHKKRLQGIALPMELV